MKHLAWIWIVLFARLSFGAVDGGTLVKLVNKQSSTIKLDITLVVVNSRGVTETVNLEKKPEILPSETYSFRLPIEKGLIAQTEHNLLLGAKNLLNPEGQKYGWGYVDNGKTLRGVGRYQPYQWQDGETTYRGYRYELH